MNKLIFDKVVGEVKDNIARRKSGKHICIPFGFSGLSKYLPGIEQSTYYLVTGNQKAGKTQIADYLFVYEPIDFILRTKSNIKLKIFDFNLEMSKEVKIRQAIVYRLFMKKGIELSIRELNSVYHDRILPDYILKFIEEDREWFEKLESIVSFIDDIRNPFGIYSHLREFYEANGKYTYRKILTTGDDGVAKELRIVDDYIPNDPDLYVIVLIDNVNLLIPERGGSLFDAIQDLSSKYMIRVRNRWRGIPVIIQQQALSQESNESVKLKRTEPSAAGLADNKITSKDCDNMLTIYSPYRNKIGNYIGYDITKLRDNYRRLAVELDRYGTTCETSLYFNGKVNFFKELPAPSRMDKDIYERIKTGRVRPGKIEEGSDVTKDPSIKKGWGFGKS